MQLSKSRRDFIKSEKAASAIEFAIILPVFLLFIFGIIQLGYVMWGYSSLEYALTAAARFAYINPTTTSAAIENYATSRVSLGSAFTVNVSITPNVSADITGTFSFSPLYILTNPISISTTVHQVLPP